MLLFTPRFRFLDTGPLVDGEMELVPPQVRWAEELLASVRHPLTVRDAPRNARVTREELDHFLSKVPFGRDPGDSARGRVPAYQFWMMLRHGPRGPLERPPVRIAGGIALRIGHTPTVEFLYGHVGYTVYPPARGNHYAERACRLLLPLARRHDMRNLWITCNPDNHASRRTCERLGMSFVDVVPVPETEPLFTRGDVQKCRYRLEL